VRLAGARRLAGRLHRGQLDEAGEPYLDHLDRVAARVAEAGGTWIQRMAAWLSGAGAHDLTALGVPPPVVRLVEALTPRRFEPFDAHLSRVVARPGALTVLCAIYQDRCRPAYIAAVSGPTGESVLRRYGRIPGVVDAGAPPDPIRTADWRAITGLVKEFTRSRRRDGSWSGRDQELHKGMYAIAHDPRHRDDPEWAAELVRLAGHKHDVVRTIALHGLGALGDPAYQPLLRERVHSAAPNEVYAAIDGLTRESATLVLSRLVEIAGGTDGRWHGARAAAVVRLSTVDDPRARAAMLANREVGFLSGREFAQRYLAGEDRDALPELIAELRRPAPGRAVVVFVLGQARAAEAVPAIVEALRDAGRDLPLAIACVDALGKIAATEAVPALAEAARHPSAAVRAQAVRALRRFDDPRCGAVALAATDDPESHVRAEAVRLLASHGGPDAVGRLCALTEGPHARTALRGLLRVADPAAVPSLWAAVRTATDRRTRHLAGRAFARSMAPGSYIPHLDPDPRIRRVAIWLAGEVGVKPYVVPGIVRALRDPDELVRSHAAATLGRVAAPSTVDALAAALDDPSPRVRASAATALGALPGPVSAAALTAHLADPHPHVRAAAAAALRRVATVAP